MQKTMHNKVINIFENNNKFRVSKTMAKQTPKNYIFENKFDTMTESITEEETRQKLPGIKMKNRDV